jgi:pimeloyl-ACP methyl ester carboxylesterase
MSRGEIRYAWSHEIALAYQIVGEGPVDLLYLQSNISNVEVNWENPALASFLTELVGLGGLVVVDRRGLGCSERFTPDGAPPIETLIDDVLAVFDAAGCEQIALVATGDCGFFACMLAASHPERLAALVLINAAPT